MPPIVFSEAEKNYFSEFLFLYKLDMCEHILTVYHSSGTCMTAYYKKSYAILSE